MKQINLVILLLATLAGCADQPAKEASIEDRGIKAVPVAPVTQPADNTTAQGAQAASAPITEAAKSETVKAETTKSAIEPAKPADNVETRAINQAPIETKPIENAKVAAEAKTMTPEAAKPVLDPKDAKGPLGQRTVLFDYDSSAIRDEFRQMLESHAQYLKDNSSVKITLQGHTDERGSPEYNIALGQRRAEAVMQALSLLGVPDSQMEAVSFGEEKPAVEGHDEAAWSQDRRTEIAYPNE